MKIQIEWLRLVCGTSTCPLKDPTQSIPIPQHIWISHLTSFLNKINASIEIASSKKIINPLRQDDSIIMTTWHAEESLIEALFFLLCSAWPDRGYEDTTACTVAVSVGSGDIAAEIRQSLADPETLIAKMAAS